MPRGKTLATDLVYDVVGCFLFSVAIQCFSAPNNIAPGGVSGISILINYLFGLPISALTLVINIPLMILAWLFLGRLFTLRTIKSVIVLTVMLQLCSYLPVYRGNILLAALFDGVLEGIGIALVFMRSSTTGGSDVASRLIQLKFPYVSVGKLLMAVDGLVLIASAIVYRNLENAMYGLIVIFTRGRVIDTLLYGLDAGKVLMIVSKRDSEIARRVNQRLERGCTILEGHGSYTSEKRNVLMCAVRKPQFIELKRIVREVDPQAFMLALEAGEVIGEGFKDIDKD